MLTHNPNKDFEVQQPPTDGISSLNFSPKANYLVATSWDNQVRNTYDFFRFMIYQLLASLLGGTK